MYRITLNFLLLHFCFFLFFTGITYSQSLEEDSLALIDLYDSTNGSEWTNNTNWLTSSALSTWRGVTVSGDRVTILNLRNNNLIGMIPSSIGDVTQLTELKLGNNTLTGSIPVTIGNLTELTFLAFINNDLTDTIPSEIGNCTKLTTIFLSNNQLTGNIPASIGSLTQLIGLFIANNQLSDTIPSELGNCPELVNLNLSTNNLSGAIPTTFENLTKLQNLVLYENQLSGSIPEEIGSLQSLLNLYLYNNNFTGGIPDAISSLQELKILYLSNNQLSGIIPSELSNLTNLTTLRLSTNQLNDTIPKELGNLASLIHLYLNGNQLSGTIPTELSDLTALTWLDLGSNQLEGSIPSALMTLTSLQGFVLSNNQISGIIPSELGSLADLVTLRLSNNQFSDTIPKELGNLTNLDVLYLDGNQLSGIIPSELGDLTSLRWLSLNSNQLVGSVPSTFINLTRLQGLMLYNNQLAGLTDLSTLKDSLTTLNVSHNQVTFEDIEPNVVITNFSYSPQDSVGTADSITRIEGNELILSISVGGTANQYQWMKDSVDIPDANSNAYTIPSISPGDSGLYNCKVTNTIATALTIYSRPTTVTVIPLSFISDSLSLIKLYDSTDGQNWTDNTNWRTENELSSWFGVTVEGRRITQLELSDNNLTGKLVAEIGNITQLHYLDLSDNNLSDTIPSELGNCTILEYLSLSSNQLSGIVPLEFNNLNNLEYLALDSNLLDSLPDLSSIAALVTLYIQNNRFTFEDIEPHVTITEFVYSPQDSVDTTKSITLIESDALSLSVSVGGTANQYQWMKNGIDISNETNSVFTISNVVPGDSGVYNCRITNTIATELTLYSRPTTVTVIPQGFIDDSLALIDLYNSTDGANWNNNTNWLTGNQLSSWFGVTVEYRRVTYILLPNNNLAGTIPPTISNLSNVVYLSLASNQLDELPDLSLCTSLDTLYIQNNRLTFEDIEPNISIPEFIYSPQDSIGTARDTTVYVGDTLTLSLAVGGTANQYQWMKNGIDIPGANSSSYTIDSVHFSDSGYYQCRITNTVATDLTLYSRPVRVIVDMSVGTQLGSEVTSDGNTFNIAPNPVNRGENRVRFCYAVKYKAEAELFIFDAVGNVVHRDFFPIYPASKNSSSMKFKEWDMRNKQGVKIACGTYLATLKIKDINGIKIVRKILAVKCD